MSAMEAAVRTMLKAMDVDVDEVKAEVTRRIGLFEQNLNTLNSTLIIIMATQARMERNQAVIAEALSAALGRPVVLEPIPAPPAKGNGHANSGDVIPAIAR